MKNGLIGPYRASRRRAKEMVCHASLRRCPGQGPPAGRMRTHIPCRTMKIDLIQASPLPFHRIRQWLSLCLLMTMASTPTAFSATETWTIGIGTANWSTAANWTGTNLPPISGDSLIFGNTAGVTTLNNDLTLTGLGTITFNADAPAYTIGGNAVIATVDGQGGLGGLSSTAQAMSRRRSTSTSPRGQTRSP